MLCLSVGINCGSRRVCLGYEPPKPRARMTQGILTSPRWTPAQDHPTDIEMLRVHGFRSGSCKETGDVFLFTSTCKRPLRSFDQHTTNELAVFADVAPDRHGHLPASCMQTASFFLRELGVSEEAYPQNNGQSLQCLSSTFHHTPCRPQDTRFASISFADT